MNEIQLTLVKKYKYDNPLITKIDSLIDNSIRDCLCKIFIHLIINVNIILVLQILVIKQQLISQFLIKAWVSLK